MYSWIEMFCGDANASTCASWAGHTTAVVDIAKWDGLVNPGRMADKKHRAGRNPFDIMSTPGLGFLDSAFPKTREEHAMIMRRSEICVGRFQSCSLLDAKSENCTWRLHATMVPNFSFPPVCAAKAGIIASS